MARWMCTSTCHRYVLLSCHVFTVYNYHTCRRHVRSDHGVGIVLCWAGAGVAVDAAMMPAALPRAPLHANVMMR
jgi:hypothetical protein